MNGEAYLRLQGELMNSESAVGDYVGEQFAQRLPALSPSIPYGICGQYATEILLESAVDSVFERKRHRSSADWSCRNSAEVRILRQGLIATLAGLHGCSCLPSDFGKSDRVVRRRRGWRRVLSGGDGSATEQSAEEHRFDPHSQCHVITFFGIAIACFAVGDAAGRLCGLLVSQGADDKCGNHCSNGRSVALKIGLLPG